MHRVVSRPARRPWPVPAALLLVLLCCGAAFSAAGDAKGDALWQALLDHPPALPQPDARLEALKALDAWLMEADSEQNEAVATYYRRAVDRALDAIEKEKIKGGARVFQLYSSSVIVQTPEIVYAIDLDQGPNRDLAHTPQEEGVPFCLTQEQIARLVRNVAVVFHTHEHDDHIDFSVTRAFLDANKQVVVTKSTQEQWKDQPWAAKLTVCDETSIAPQSFGPLNVDVFHDMQWGDNAHTRGTPCNAYLIVAPDGTTIAVKGDINSGENLYEWLTAKVKEGRHVDAMVGSPLFWRGKNMLKEIDALLAPTWLPGHIWEFGHRSAGARGGATGTYASAASLRLLATKGKVAVLSWGEYIDIPAPTR